VTPSSVPLTEPAIGHVRVGELSVIVRRGETILDALRRADVWVPYECGWGSCGTCKAQLVSGEIRYRSQPSCLRPHDAKLKRIALCQAEPISPEVVIRPLRVSDRPDPHLATVDVHGRLQARRWITHDLFELDLELSQPVRYTPGQYALLEWNGQRRCYSMVDPSGESGTDNLRFLIRLYASGTLSPVLATLPIGTEISLQVPYGGAYLRPAPQYLLIAGGTGIAPLRAIIKALDAHHLASTWLLYGAATPTHLAYAEELALLLRPDRFLCSVDRPTSHWAGPTGPVTDLLPKVLPSLDTAAVRCYLAGPPAMVTAAERLLRDAGIGAERIHADAFA